MFSSKPEREIVSPKTVDIHVSKNAIRKHTKLNETSLEVHKSIAEKDKVLIENNTVDFAVVPKSKISEKIKDKRLTEETTLRYAKEFFLNGLADIVVEGLVFDSDYVIANQKALKEETIERLEKMVDDKIFDITKDGNIVVREMWEASVEYGKYLTEAFFKNENIEDFEKTKGSLYDGFKESFIVEAATGISTVLSIVTETVKKETERALKVKSLTEEVEEFAAIQQAGGNKVPASKLHQLKEASFPTFYQAINNMINEEFISTLTESGNLVEGDLDKIMSETIKVYTLTETLNVFRIVEFDRKKMNSSIKRVSSFLQ